MTAYGLPYLGSKNGIAEWVVDHLPAAHTLVDLMAGGCSVTHCALLSGKYKHIIANDVSDVPSVFQSAIQGEITGYATVPDRDTFTAHKTTDTLMSLLYSFGNNREDYLWSRELEPVKVAASRMIVAPSAYERRIAYRGFIHALDDYLHHDGELQPLLNLQGQIASERMQTLTALQGLVREEKVENLRLIDDDKAASLTILQGDYRHVELPPPRTASSTSTRHTGAQSADPTTDSTPKHSTHGRKPWNR